MARIAGIDLPRTKRIEVGLTYIYGIGLSTAQKICSTLELDPNEYTQLLGPLVAGRADVVYGSRFLNPTSKVPLKARTANRFLTMLTNVLFGGSLTDMETAYKVMTREALAGIRLRCVGFDIEPELTARLLRAGRRIVEVPISYNPRRVDEGKKMRFIDGVDAIYTLFKCRFT